MSLTNFSTSAMVGGKPVKSRLKRRISCVLAASGEGASPCCSSFANTKLSIGFFTHALFLTSGMAERTGATNDQCLLSAALCVLSAESFQIAPASIHWRINSICSGFSGSPPIGIRASPPSPKMRRIKSEALLLPGVIAFKAKLLSSRRRSACDILAP